jgi:glycosyltransferase involved in cell wall biosynthesis
MPSTVSIALCTYNGAAFIAQQLDSLLAQTHQNCEIIVVDDHSADDTISIIRRYADNHSSIKLYTNSENLGYTKNFEKAISLCTGAYIALCDQDDIWLEDKISTMVRLIGDNMLAYHDSEFVDEDGQPMNKRLSNIKNCYSGNDSRIFLFENCVLGHALMFRREMLPYIGKFTDTVIHDRWLAYVATNTGSILFIDQPLVKYRQHRNANTNILFQERANSKKSDSVYKMQFMLDIVKVLANYKFNKDVPFKKKLLSLAQERMNSYTSFSLAFFIFINRGVLLYISKKSFFSKLNFALKHVWGGKIKRLSFFNIER